jgi:hypothetical protein
VNGTPPTHPFFASAGVITFLLCIYFSQLIANHWRKTNGVAPPPSNTREGNREYKNRLSQNMPSDVKRQIRILQGFGWLIFIAGIYLAR